MAMNIIHKLDIHKKLEILENELNQETKQDSDRYRRRRSSFFSSEKTQKHLESVVRFNVNSFIKNHGVKLNKLMLDKISLAQGRDLLLFSKFSNQLKIGG